MFPIKRSHLGCLIVCIFLFNGHTVQADDVPKMRGDKILEEMFEKREVINTLTYRLEKKERIKNKLIEEAIFIKLSINPFKVYSKMDYPK